VTRLVRVFRDLPTASAALADHLEERARVAVRARGRFTLVLSGGSTPTGLFRRLGRRRSRTIPWRRTEVFFSDERAVPPTDPMSNFGSAQRLLLAHVPIPSQHVHRIEGELRPVARAADRYERRLTRRVRFDVVLLGLGEDAHTASLFPNSPALRARRRRVVAVDEAGEPPFVPRLTLTVPALAASREICFLVAGESKATAVANVFRSPAAGSDAVPASRVRSVGPITWYLDRAAASRLPTPVDS